MTTSPNQHDASSSTRRGDKEDGIRTATGAQNTVCFFFNFSSLFSTN